MHDGVPHGLPGAVLVVVVVLALGVVHRHHGAGQGALPLPGLQAEYPGGGLLTAAQQAVGVLGALARQQVHQIAAVVDDDVGAALQGLDQVGLVLLRGGAVPGVDIDPPVGHPGGHVVLGGQGVGAGEVDLGAPLPEDQPQVGGLGLQVDGDGHAHSGEGLLLHKAGLDLGQGGHMAAHPVDFAVAGGGQGGVADDAHKYNSLSGGNLASPV